MQKQAGYMAAPERFAESQIPLAPRAPSIHGPSRRSRLGRLPGKADIYMYMHQRRTAR